MLDSKRIETMLKRLGVDAVALIDDKRYLPFYRSIQIKLEKKGVPEEWQKMIDLAKTKDEPSKYFARCCKKIKDGVYQFGQKARAVRQHTFNYVSNKLKQFGFGAYHKYWAYKAVEFVERNNEGDFVDLIDYCKRKHRSEKYLAKSLANMDNLDVNFMKLRSISCE